MVCLLGLCILILGFGLMASENFTPRDRDEAWKWMDESMKRAGVKDVKMEDGNVTGQTAKGPFVINLTLVSSVKEEGMSVSSNVTWYEFRSSVELLGPSLLI